MRIPRASRIASASSSDARVPDRARPAARRWRSRAAGRTRRSRRPARSARTFLRPWRIGDLPALAARAAQRHRAGLGRHLRRDRLQAVELLRGQRAPRRACPTSSSRARTSAGVSSPSQPAPNTAPTHGVRRNAAHASSTASASGLARPGLVAVGEHVAADVQQDDPAAAELRRPRRPAPRRPRAGPGWGRRARVRSPSRARDVRLAEQKATGPARVRGPRARRRR